MMLTFKNSDFHGDPYITWEDAAMSAQEVFDKWVAETGKVVYSKWKKEYPSGAGFEVLGELWHPLKGRPDDTHRATLIGIEEI